MRITEQWGTRGRLNHADVEIDDEHVTVLANELVLAIPADAGTTVWEVHLTRADLAAVSAVMAKMLGGAS